MPRFGLMPWGGPWGGREDDGWRIGIECSCRSGYTFYMVLDGWETCDVASVLEMPGAFSLRNWMLLRSGS